MGLYSTNRVVQLSNYMGESTIDFEHIDTDESAPNLLESSIMLHEADQQMFDTLIGLDFVEAHNEQAMLEDGNSKDSATSSDANKAVSKNIFQKIVDIIQRAIEVVKNAIKTAINKVREFINNTANKAVAHRLKNYDWSNFKPFKVNFYPDDVYYVDETQKIPKWITKIKNFVSSADIDNTSAEDLEAEIKKISDEADFANSDREDANTKTERKYTVTVDYAKHALDIISKSDKTISNLNKAGNEATTALLKLKQRVGKPKKDDPKTANKLYSFATDASKAITKLVQATINKYVAALKVARSIVLKIAKGEASEANNESAYDSFVGSISDIYVENYFADLFD